MFKLMMISIVLVFSTLAQAERSCIDDTPTCRNFGGTVYCGYSCDNFGGTVYCGKEPGETCKNFGGTVYCGTNCENFGGTVYCATGGIGKPARPAHPAL